MSSTHNDQLLKSIDDMLEDGVSTSEQILEAADKALDAGALTAYKHAQLVSFVQFGDHD